MNLVLSVRRPAAAWLVLIFLLSMGLVLIERAPAQAQADAPDTYISAGPVEGSTINADSVSFWAHARPDSGNHVSCSLWGETLVAGPTDCTLRSITYQLSGLADGTYVFEATASSQDGGSDPTPATRAFTLSSSIPEGTESVQGRGDVTTDPEKDGAHPNDLVETKVDTYPNDISNVDVIIHETTVRSVAPAGWTYYGQEVQISAPPEEAAHPLWISFTIDYTATPKGVPYRDDVFFNGVRVPLCADHSGTASPDPCVHTYGSAFEDDSYYWVNSTQGGTWNFGQPSPPDPSPSPSPTPSSAPTPAPTASATPTPSPSPTDDVEARIQVASDLSVRFDFGDRSFVGKVSSDRAGCRKYRRVRIFRVRPGLDRVVGSAEASYFGRWVVDPSVVRAGRYYAKVSRKTISGRETEVICLPGRSTTVRVAGS